MTGHELIGRLTMFGPLNHDDAMRGGMVESRFVGMRRRLLVHVDAMVRDDEHDGVIAQARQNIADPAIDLPVIAGDDVAQSSLPAPAGPPARRHAAVLIRRIKEKVGAQTCKIPSGTLELITWHGGDRRSDKVSASVEQRDETALGS